MTPDECSILNFFRRFEMGPAQMLFVTPGDCKVSATPFRNAVESLVDRGLIVRENRHKQAFSLTRNGYAVSRLLRPNLGPAPTPARKPTRPLKSAKAKR